MKFLDLAEAWFSQPRVPLVVDFRSSPLAPRPEDCLAGGGEMGERMRAFDWASHPLGPVTSWPQSLRTAVSMMLASRFAMVVAWGPEFRFFYNDRYVPVLGDKHPRALGTPCREIFPEIWDELIGPEFERTRRGETFAVDDWYLPLVRNGYRESCWFTVSYSPIRDETGGVGGMLAVVAETTERVEGERRLATLRELATRAAEARTPEQACANAALALGLNGNDVPFAVLYALDETGRTARRFAHVGIADDHAAAAPVIDLASELSPWPFATVTRSKTPLVVDDLVTRHGALPGGPYPEATTSAILLPLVRPGLAHPYGVLVAGVSPRRALDDRYRGFYELAADHIATGIGNAHALEQQRKRAEELAALDRAKTTFFSNVSHEFRTPLALMLGPLEDLLAGRHGDLTPEQYVQHELVHRNALRMHKLVNTLLDFSRIEAGRARAAFEPTDLSALTSELAGMFRAAIERAGLELVVDCPPLPETIFVDRDMWEKIVLNLLSNAFKFTFHGRIRVTLRHAGDFVELAVRDTGCGIPPEELGRVFERFHRVDRMRSRTHEGTGIGLALSLELARLHGGTIDVESEPGKGTQFTAKVRTGRAHLPPDHVIGIDARSPSLAHAYVSEAMRWIPDATPHRPTEPVPSGRVVVVDDNADMRDYLRRTLELHWAVTTVGDGAAALAEIRRAPPDAVITDVMMPGMDGFALIAALRADERTRDTPVLVVSARAGDEARVEGLQRGADDYIVKPFSARELVARVGTQIANRRAAEQQRAAMATLFDQAPGAIAVVRGDNLVFEIANRHYLAARGITSDVVGKPLLDVFPQFRGRGYEDYFLRVLHSGAPLSVAEMEVEGRWWTFSLAPIANERGIVDRVMSVSYEVTELVQSRRRAEAAAASLQQTVSLLDATLASLPIGMAFYDRDLRIASVNETAARWNHLDAAAIVGRALAEFVPADALEATEARIRQVFATGRASETIMRTMATRAEPGVTRHWLLTHFPVRGVSGEVTQVGVCVVDVTREQTARREAELQRAHLHQVLMEAPTPICILRGPQHVIELANEHVCAVWRRTHEQVIGKPLLEALPELRGQDFDTLLRTVLATGIPYIGKEMRAELLGHEVFFNFVYSPMHGVGGQIEGVLVMAFDVTDEVRAREEKQRTIEYNEKFTAMLGHDLRNPLNAIATTAQLLLRRANRPEIARPAARIEAGCERMARMITQLLDLARVRAGTGLALAPRPLDLGELSQLVVDELQLVHPECKVELSATGSLHGKWDRERLAQVLSHIASNAIEHGEPRTPVHVQLDGRDAQRVSIRIENRGAIAPDVLPTLFEPFRGIDQRNEKTRGLGLGLYISKEIIAAHRGRIDVRSSPENGTCFEIELPKHGEVAT